MRSKPRKIALRGIAIGVYITISDRLISEKKKGAYRHVNEKEIRRGFQATGGSDELQQRTIHPGNIRLSRHSSQHAPQVETKVHTLWREDGCNGTIRRAPTVTEADSGVGRGERHIKKSFGLLRTTSTLTREESYRFIEAQKEHGRAKWAKILNVSKSGYYSWRKNRDVREARSKDWAEKVLRVFHDGAGHYGVERICGILRSRGGSASYRAVRRVLNENGLGSSHARRRRRTVPDGRTVLGDGYPNLTRGLPVTAPFHVLSSDISCIRTGEGTEYLCQIQDVYSKVILGRCQQERQTADIVLKALSSACHRWSLSEGVIFHSDRGSQYTSEKVMNCIRELGWRQSFSRAGRPGDNAWSESFFSILKKEAIHHSLPPTREASRQRIYEYIEMYYNRCRVQKGLGYHSPVEYLTKWQKEHTHGVA